MTSRPVLAARRALRVLVPALALSATAAAPAAPAAAQEPADTAVHRVDTLRVEVARLRAGGVPLGRVPFGAQVVAVEPLPRAGELTLADALRGAVGVSTASQFGSAAQPDVRFRGFQVGPVVGFPQSVSVFVDGVRVNEPDASQVNFDLVPLHAVERIEVVRTPGGPFGRNTLAGALNVVTRRGGPGERSGGAAGLTGGSFGTADAQGWAGGGLGGGFDYLVSGRHHRSEGWRDLSATRLRQLFAKVGYRGERDDVWLSYTFADNHVEGPGSLPRSWLEGRLPPELAGTRDPRRLQFTGFQGDWFSPRLHFAVLGARRTLGERTALQLNGFARSNRFSQVNDNITEPNARGETDVLSGGGTAQVVHSLPSGTAWTAGVEYVRNRTDILIFEEPNPAFPAAGGMTESVASVEDNLGAFVHLWWPLSPRASLTGSLRYDHVFLPVTDRLDPENSGENTFGQATGSLGGDLAVSDAVRAFASYGRGFRAPVILEISCADPEDPCPLPFELGADPPLDPVTTDTWQAGLRFFGPRGTVAELVGFRAEVYDDLFAVVAPPSTRGYFKNLERTRREGLELSALARPLRELELRGSLALTRATFRSEATLASALLVDGDDDSAAPGPDDDGEHPGAVEVEPGNRFAMVPGVTAEGGVRYSPGRWGVELEGTYVGSQFFLGDEWNRMEFGKLPAYFVLDGSAERELGSFTLTVRGQNLLGTEHHTFGIISPNVRGPEEGPQPFLTPGLPFRLLAGIRYRF
ncbi:MAG: TonB-dependent receptor [Gemmatimonadota bacterium]